MGDVPEACYSHSITALTVTKKKTLTLLELLEGGYVIVDAGLLTALRCM